MNNHYLFQPFTHEHWANETLQTNTNPCTQSLAFSNPFAATASNKPCLEADSGEERDFLVPAPPLLVTWQYTSAAEVVFVGMASSHT